MVRCHGFLPSAVSVSSSCFSSATSLLASEKSRRERFCLCPPCRLLPQPLRLLRPPKPRPGLSRRMRAAALTPLLGPPSRSRVLCRGMPACCWRCCCWASPCSCTGGCLVRCFCALKHCPCLCKNRQRCSDFGQASFLFSYPCRFSFFALCSALSLSSTSISGTSPSRRAMIQTPGNAIGWQPSGVRSTLCWGSAWERSSSIAASSTAQTERKWI